jgi:hypothetical protein
VEWSLWLLDEMAGWGGECIGIGVMWCARVRIGEPCSGSYGCLAEVRIGAFYWDSYRCVLLGFV